MNVFIIPSWYPTDAEPVGGIFVKEQAESLAENFPEHNFVVSHCENFYLSVTDPPKFIKTSKMYLKSKPVEKKIKHNLFEFYNPAATYSEKLGGEIKNIVEANSENFISAQNKLGQIDILHAHVSYPAGYSAMELKKKFNVPYIITEHMGPFPFDKFILNGKLSDKISEPLMNANRIIAVSNFLSDAILSYGMLKPIVIPNMVNEKIFYPVNKIKSDDLITFLTVSSLIESKGIKELLDGILLSNESFSQNKFIIAGRGLLENYIKEFIVKNNLSHKITLVNNPSRDSIIELFHECDVFILPSRMESFGIVYIEAMACGKPVIATDCGGPADFVKSFNGRLIPINSPDKISEAINFFTKHIRDFSVEKIRKYYLQNFSQKIVCSKIVSVYKENLNQ